MDSNIKFYVEVASLIDFHELQKCSTNSRCYKDCYQECYKMNSRTDRHEQPWLKKNAFLARILQDFLSRSYKIMHFSARHLARKNISLQDSSKEKNFVEGSRQFFLFFIFIVFDFKLTTAS